MVSSLLDILAGRKDPSGLQGTVLVNGRVQPKNFKCVSGYVVQVNNDGKGWLIEYAIWASRT